MDVCLCVCVLGKAARREQRERKRENKGMDEWPQSELPALNNKQHHRARKGAQTCSRINLAPTGKKKKQKKTGHKREKHLWSVESQIQLQKRAKVKFGHTHHNRLSTTIRCFSSKRNLQKKKTKRKKPACSSAVCEEEEDECDIFLHAPLSLFPFLSSFFSLV